MAAAIVVMIVSTILRVRTSSVPPCTWRLASTFTKSVVTRRHRRVITMRRHHRRRLGISTGRHQATTRAISVATTASLATIALRRAPVGRRSVTIISSNSGRVANRRGGSNGRAACRCVGSADYLGSSTAVRSNATLAGNRNRP